MPLSELVAPGVPYPLVAAAAGDTVLGVASVLLLCAYAPADSVSAATAAMNVLVALIITRSSLIGLKLQRKRSIRIRAWRSLYD
jgi:hypothetical protein